MKSFFKSYLRKAAFVFIAFAFINTTLDLKAEHYTVTVTGPGQLENAVSQLVGGSANYYLITSLTVIGNLNRADINFLQDLRNRKAGRARHFGNKFTQQHFARVRLLVCWYQKYCFTQFGANLRMAVFFQFQRKIRDHRYRHFGSL